MTRPDNPSFDGEVEHFGAGGSGPQTGGPSRRTWAVAVVAAVLVGSGIGLISSGAGQGPAGVPAADRIPSAPAGASGSGPASAAPTVPVNVTGYDPLAGGSGFLAPGTAGAPSATFVTEHYRSPTFAGLKPGVGLLADFGHPVSIGHVSFTAAVAGTTVQVLAGDLAPNGASPLASASPVRQPAGQTVVATTITAAHRFWMLWCTRLGSDGRGGWWAGYTPPTFGG